MPGRSAELRLRSSLILLLGLALPGPGIVSPATAQEPPPEGASRVGALVEIGGGLTTLRGDAAWVVDGVALVALAPGVAVGGGGTVFPSDRDVEGDLVFPDRALGFGYGGVVVEVAVPLPERTTDLAMRVLLGAGNTDLRDRRTGTRIASDNVLVVEPELILRRPLASRWNVGFSLSWRGVLGVDDLEDVDSADLTAITLGVHLRMGPF